METGLTCQGRSCHYLRVGRKPETLMEKSTTSTTLTSAPAGSTPETGRTVSPSHVFAEDVRPFDPVQVSPFGDPEVVVFRGLRTMRKESSGTFI